MSFYKVEENEAIFRDMFNEEHSSHTVAQVQKQNMQGKTLKLHNCGVRIMKQLFDNLSQHGIYGVNICYDWDSIMLYPKLVSWDKMTWKNVQQINNWNKVWRQLFTPLRDLRKADIHIRCSWMSEDFLKSVLESLISVPFLQECKLSIEAKNKNLIDILEAYKKANLIKKFDYSFFEWKGGIAS